MRVLEIHAENIKRVSVVDITPEGELVEISGNNGNGKTSVLDAIMWGLEGKAKIQWEPITHGKQTGIIKLALGDDDARYRITRTLKQMLHADGTYIDGFVQELKVEDMQRGGKLKRPQEVLDALLGEISLDPLEFVRSSAKERLEFLKSLVKGFDFKLHADRRLRLYDERTEIGRDRDRLAHYAEELSGDDRFVVEEGLAITDIDPLVKKLGEIGAQASNRAREEMGRSRLRDQVTNIAQTVKQNMERQDQILKDAERQIEALKDKNKQLLADASAIAVELEKLPPLPDVPDPTPIEREIADVREMNKVAERYQQWVKAREKATAAGDSYAKKTRQIDRIDEAVRQAIAQANLPVPGIELGEEDVMLNGVRFEQASHAEQVRAAMGLAMAGKPDLKIVAIREGAFLDQNSFGLVRELAKAQGFQVFIETITPHTPAAIVMEDGRVKA